MMGMAIFMFGMLGVAALLLSSINGSYFSGNASNAITLATSRLERLVYLDEGNADLTAGSHTDTTDPKYTVNWNVTSGVPMSNTRTVTVSVVWSVKGNNRTITLAGVAPEW